MVIKSLTVRLLELSRVSHASCLLLSPSLTCHLATKWGFKLHVCLLNWTSKWSQTFCFRRQLEFHFVEIFPAFFAARSLFRSAGTS